MLTRSAESLEAAIETRSETPSFRAPFFQEGEKKEVDDDDDEKTKAKRSISVFLSFSFSSSSLFSPWRASKLPRATTYDVTRGLNVQRKEKERKREQATRDEAKGREASNAFFLNQWKKLFFSSLSSLSLPTLTDLGKRACKRGPEGSRCVRYLSLEDGER